MQRHSRAGLARALVALAALSGCARRPPPVASKPTELVAEGVRVAKLAPGALPPGPALSGQAGDFVIESDRVRAVVGGGGAGAEAAAMLGAVIDVTGVEWQADLLRELRIVARAGDQEIPLSTVAVEPAGGKGPPKLVIVQRGTGVASGLELRTEVTASRGQPWIALVTRAENRGQRSIAGLRLGTAIRWLRGPPFVPNTGSVQGPTREATRWFAISSARQSYAVAFADGSAQVSFLKALEDSAEQLALGPRVELVPRATAVHERMLIVMEGGVPAVAEHAWRLTGERVGRVRGKLDPAPEWARVEARTQAGELALSVDVARDGAFDFALPAGTWRLVLRAPGGRDEERIAVTPERLAEPRFIVPTPSVLAYRVRDAEGPALSARLVVRGIAPTADPDLGPPHQASGAKIAAYTATGTGSLSLPPGRYDVVVTRGMEYTLDRQEVEVDAAEGATVRATLKRIVETPGLIGCDFHLHASPSGDSRVPLADRVTSLLAEGIELAVATDHNHVTDYGPSVEALGAREKLATARGVEITTPRWGHFNTFPLPEGAAPPPYADVTPIAIFQAVRSAAPRAVIQVNHPRMPHGIGYFSVGGLGADGGPQEGFSFDFDTIEVFNGFDLPHLAAVERNLEEWFSLLATGRRYTAVGNSDSHDLAQLYAGYPRTYVRVEEDRPEDVSAEAVAEALKSGRAFVTSGPIVDLVVSGGRPGDLVVPADSRRVAVEVAVRAAPWVDVSKIALIVSGRRALEEAVPGSQRTERHRLRTELALDEDSWVVAVVRGEQRMNTVLPYAQTVPFAFTNPVYVDVDGDGAFRAARDGGP